MPARFPGIDPYLESQHYWPDFHSTFIGACREGIAEGLPDHYEARVDERIRLVGLPEERPKDFEPDVAVTGRTFSADPGPAAVTVLDREPITIPFVIFEEVREVYIKILHRPDRNLVAIVEVLSPDNKYEPGHGEYLAKRNDLLRRPVHLIELDLLTNGHRLPMARPLPPGDAYAIVARWDRHPDGEVYAWSIRQPLPRIRLPLQAPDADLVLDLAAVYATAYARGRYARSVDYQAPLTLPLAPEDRAWAENLARG